MESDRPALKKNARVKKTQEVRINSGQLRGRKLTFPAIDGLRPSLGRSRETLFNWLRPMLVGANCLDLFAGSGVIGFEAASIGASQVTFVEKHPDAAAHLGASIAGLEVSERCQLWTGDARDFLGDCTNPFDVIFLDPPFAQPQLLESAITAICERSLLNHYLYLEFDQQQEPAIKTLLAAHHLSVERSSKAGTTGSWLIAPEQRQG